MILNGKKPSSSDFDELLKDKNCIKIANKVLKKYNKYLSKDEKFQCYCLGLYNCLFVYPYNGQVKFTAYLYRHVSYVVKNYRREFNECPKKPIHTFKKNNIDLSLDVQSIIDSLSEEEQKIVKLYYFENYTMTEIGLLMEMSRLSVFRRIKKIHKKIAESGVLL